MKSAKQYNLRSFNVGISDAIDMASGGMIHTKFYSISLGVKKLLAGTHPQRHIKTHTGRGRFFFGNPILFAICTSAFSKLCKRCIQWHVEECSVALLCN
jgi:hypothetical protein